MALGGSEMTQNGSDNFQLPVMQRMAEVGNCLELSGNTQHTQRQKNFVSRNAGDQKNYCKNYVLCINLLSSTSFLMYSKNTDKSLDECRRVQTNVDESQTNADECGRVQTCHQTSVDESKNFYLIQDEVTNGHILLLLHAIKAM